MGSAVGLGTIWRFPSEVQSNGGSVFLIAYLVCVVLVGIPVMLAEFSVGRGSGSDAIGAYRKLTPGKPWWIIGALSVLAPYLIMMYYMVVAGWTAAIPVDVAQRRTLCGDDPRSKSVGGVSQHYGRLHHRRMGANTLDSRDDCD